MGLRDYKSYKKLKEFESVLEELGVSLDDLKSIKSLHEKIARLEQELKALADENRALKERESAENMKILAENKKRAEQQLTPEKFVEQFAGEIEEYYPNGIGRES